MIQVSDFIAMFAPSSPKDIILIFKRRAFLCPIGSIVSKDIRLSIPIREYPFFIDCILVLWRDIGRRQPFLYLYISITFSFMPKNSVICNAVNNSTRTATSAHETGIRFFILSLDSNTLRYYTPFGKRRRKSSDSATMRQSLCNAMLSEYPGIRRIKIKDCGIRFYARVWMHSGRVIHHKAYSLRNLAGILCEKVENQEITLS